MTKRRSTKFDRFAKSIANSLTAEQAIKLYDFIQPIDANDPVRKMTDDELLAELEG